MYYTILTVKKKHFYLLDMIKYLFIFDTISIITEIASIGKNFI